MGNDYIVFGKPDLQADEIQEVIDSMARGWIGTGPKVQRFEKLFAEFKRVDAHHVAAVNSCTAALHLSLLACGIRPGDEVITTAMTFCATVNAIIHAGGTPVLADVLPDSYNIDPDDLRRKITPRTKAVVPVHFSGLPCDMDAICGIAEEHGLKIVEDCAHAVEGEYKGRPLGTFGEFACFSFYATKNMTTGEGGMVVAKSKAEIDRIRTLALHGMSADAWSRFSDEGYKHYQVTEVGFKYNMMDLQAAMGIHQLRRVEENWQRRRRLFSLYREALADLPVQLPADAPAHSKASYHLFPILIEDGAPISRDDFLMRAHKRGVGTGVHYLSIPSHVYYRRTFGWNPEDFPVSHRVGRTTASLPFSPALTDEEVDRVLRVTRELLGGSA